MIIKDTFDLEAIPREGESIIPVRVMYKVKILSTGEIDKLKARIVVRGDIQQRYGVLSKIHTWVTTAGFKILHRLLAEAAKRGKRVRQLDFIAAFCQGKMQGRLFIQFPSIFMDLFPNHREYFTKPLLLKRDLYGTSHLGKFWDNDLKEWMHQYGFVTCLSDQSLNILRRKMEWLYVINYVDDQLYFGSSRQFKK